jgi:integrase
MVFNKAVEWGKLDQNPAARVRKLPEPPPVDRILTKDETSRLLAAAGERIRPIIITALATGLRRGELFALRWKDIDFDRRLIIVRISKSGKSRKVPFGPAVAATLDALPRCSEFVFPGQKKGRPLQSIYDSFHNACVAAQIEDLRFHDLRHSYASGLIEAGVDIATVSRILGHANILMTQKYLHPSAETFIKAAEKADALLGPNH